jgi:hypothetical protein
MARSSWGFVGGYFLYFLGLVAGFVGAVVAQGEHGRPYGDDTPETLVIFVMTPIPAVLAVVFHLVGKYFRRADGTLLRVLLLGGGVYLAATTGMDVANHGVPVGEDDPMAFAWPLALAAGVGLALLGLVPPGRADADVPYAEVA